MTVLRSVMLGCGSYLPSQILTNEELAHKVDTSDDWIVQRTGIHERRIAAPGEHTSHMAIRAAQAALAHAHVDAQSIDLIILATSTPDNTFPASAVSVQAGLGITHGAAFDLQAVCSGFVFALATTRTDSSGLRASELGVHPAGAAGSMAVPIVSTALPARVSITLTEFRLALATYSTLPPRAKSSSLGCSCTAIVAASACVRVSITATAVRFQRLA